MTQKANRGEQGTSAKRTGRETAGLVRRFIRYGSSTIKPTAPTRAQTPRICLCNPGQKIRVTSNIKLRAIPYYERPSKAKK